MTEVNSLSIIENTDMTSFKATMSKIGQFQKLVRENLSEGKDYGKIPGTSKPTLYKPGAEKILMLMGLQSTYEIIDSTRDWKEGFFQYQVRCTLKKENMVITQGLGCCNSKENKYMKQSPFNIDNTILKMAKKRSQVDASLTVASLSEIFTQDVEDIGVDDDRHNNSPDKTRVQSRQDTNNDPPNPDLATQAQKDKIYGTVVCEKCGTRVYGFKCPKCKNANNIHIATKGFIHSHLLTKDDFKKNMKPILLPDKLTKTDAMIIWDWWLGKSDKFITGERTKRETRERETKPTKSDKIKQARVIASGKVEVKDKGEPFPDEEITDEDIPGSSIDHAIPSGGKRKNVLT